MFSIIIDNYPHRRMGTLWLGGAEGLICPKPLGHCLCDVIIHIPKGLICSFLWPIFSSCFARISPTVCPNFTHCLPEFHPLFARISPTVCPNFTHCLPEFHPLFARISPTVCPNLGGQLPPLPPRLIRL